MEKLDGKVLLEETEYTNLVKLAEAGTKAGESKPKGTTTSKKILIVCWSIAVALIVLTVLALFLTYRDVSPLVTLTSIAITAAGADTAMYSWKAKAENKIKLTQVMVQDLAKDIGIENMMRVAQMVLSD